MKKIKLFILASIVAITSFPQVPITDLAHIDLPKEAEKITQEQLKLFVKGKKEYSKTLQDENKKGNIYKIKTMILQLNGSY